MMHGRPTTEEGYRITEAIWKGSKYNNKCGHDGKKNQEMLIWMKPQIQSVLHVWDARDMHAWSDNFNNVYKKKLK